MTMQKTAPQAQKRCCFIGITSTWRKTAVFAGAADMQEVVACLD